MSEQKKRLGSYAAEREPTNAGFFFSQCVKHLNIDREYITNKQKDRAHHSHKGGELSLLFEL